MDRKQFGQLVAARRESCADPDDPAQSLSVRKLAKLANTGHTTISRIERGERGASPSLIAALDRALATGGDLIEAGDQKPVENSLPVVPTQLPPEPALVNRGDLLEAIAAAAEAPSSQSSASVIVLTGTGGVGKTALATVSAHAFAKGGGALWADMRGWDPSRSPRRPAAVARGWCRALGAGANELVEDEDEIVGLWRTLTATRELVAVIDNARSDQIEPLIPASPNSVIFVTTRDRMVSVSGVAEKIEVQPLLRQHATDLLARHARMPKHVIAPVASKCDGLPLALRVLGEELATHWTQETLDEMNQHWDNLTEGSALDRSTALSYQGLNPEAARAWRLCAHLATLTLERASAVLGESTTDTRGWLTEATNAHLLTGTQAGWDYHDMHREYALRASQKEDTEKERRASIYRGLTWFLHGLAAADHHFVDRDDQPHLVPLADHVAPPEFDDYTEAIEWTDRHWDSLEPAVRRAVDQGWTRLAWQLVAISLHYAFLTKPWNTWDSAAVHAAEAAEAAGDREGLGWMHHVRGSILGEKAEHDAAIEHLTRGLEYRREIGHTRDVGWSAINTARFRLIRGDDDIAPLIDEAIAAHETIGMKAGVCLGLTLKAALHVRTGELDSAVEQLQRARALAPELGDPAITCWTETRYAEVLVKQGHTSAAQELVETTDDYAREHEADWYRIDALLVLTETYPSTEQKRDALHTAVVIADKLGDPREEELRARLDALA